jgi:hypothetical protein
VGYLALTFFALVVVVPQLVLPVVAAPQPVAELDHAAAVALYAQAIADELKLGRRTRLVVNDAAQFIRERPLCPRDGKLSDFSIGHRLAVVEAVIYYREHWDGRDGTPGAVGGEMIPLTSRILAVADAWSGLTASNSPELTHPQALNQIEARAGMHFDPHVVEAAVKLVREQRLGLPGDVAYQPRVQQLGFSDLAGRAVVLVGHLLKPARAGELGPLPSRRLI